MGPEKDTTEHGPQFSFRPTISPASERRPRRGPTELSTGDLQRRNDQATALRKQYLEAEQETLPFSPRISKAGARTEGRMRVLQEPELYMKRVTEKQEVTDARGKEAAERREAQACAECTFHPKINVDGAPAYVRQLAECHRRARELRDREKENCEDMQGAKAMPDWR